MIIIILILCHDDHDNLILVACILQESLEGQRCMEVLPGPALMVLLSHVPLKQRIATCTLVCKRWHAEATQSSTTITHTLTTQQQVDSLEGFLHKHGQDTTSLDLATTATWPPASRQPARLSALALPCPKRQHLRLKHFLLNVAANASHTAIMMMKEQPGGQLQETAHNLTWPGAARVCD